MRTERASRRERLLRLWEQNLEASTAAGLTRVRVEDERLAGNVVTINGHRLLNFACFSILLPGRAVELAEGEHTTLVPQDAAEVA